MTPAWPSRLLPMPTRQSSPMRNRGVRQLRPDLSDSAAQDRSPNAGRGFSGSRRSVQARCGPRRRLVRPYPEHALRRLDFVTGTPSRNESARKGGVEEVDRHRIVEHPAHPGRCHCPAIGAAILVEPRGHFGVAPAEPAERNTDPDADREASLGREDHVARVTRHLEFLVCSDQNGTHDLGVSSRSLLAMCGRVRLSSDVSEIKLVFSIPPHRPPPNTAPSWNVAPTDPMPVIRYDAKAGERSLDVMRWGLVPFWAKDLNVSFSNINAKAEGIENKPAFREAFQRRRCLVPVDNFYEWKKTATRKQPYAIALADRKLMALAGLWENWHSPAGEWVRSFAIINDDAKRAVRRTPQQDAGGP